MDPEERARRFGAAAETELATLPRIQRDTLGEIVRQLEVAERTIIEKLQAHSSESAGRRLRQLKLEVEQAMEDFRAAVVSASSDGVDQAFPAGVRSVVQPFQAAGVSLVTTGIDKRALLASRHFMTDRIAEISLKTINRINAALVQHVIDASSLSDTVTAVQRIMGGVPRARAMTIAYTEIGRVNAMAQDQAMQDAGASVPHLHKRWLHNIRRHPRASHLRANNQIRRYDEPYLVDGEELRFPRDPKGSAGNTINCGCQSLPVVDGSSFGASTIRIDDQGHVRKVRLPS